MNGLRKNTLLYALTVLAITLSVMVTITPLWAKSGSTIEICSTLGSKTISIDENGKPVPPTPKLKKSCSTCLAASADILVSPETPFALNTLGERKHTKIKQKLSLVDISQCRLTDTPRAPPIFS